MSKMTTDSVVHATATYRKTKLYQAIIRDQLVVVFLLYESDVCNSSAGFWNGAQFELQKRSLMGCEQVQKSRRLHAIDCKLRWRWSLRPQTLMCYMMSIFKLTLPVIKNISTFWLFSSSTPSFKLHWHSKLIYRLFVLKQECINIVSILFWCLRLQIYSSTVVWIVMCSSWKSKVFYKPGCKFCLHWSILCKH